MGVEHMFSQNFEYFLTIAETKSVTKASEKLYISQPSLSQYLKKLEEELGVKLFTRKNNSMELTDMGKRFQEYINQCILLDLKFQRDIASLSQYRNFLLRMGAPSWTGSVIFPEVVPRISMVYPDMNIELTEAGSSALINQYNTNKLDIMIFHAHPDLPQVDSEILFRDSLYLVIKATHPLVMESGIKTSKQTKVPISMEALRKERLIITDHDLIMTKIIKEYLYRNGIEPGKVLVAKNIVTIMNLVAMGAGYSFLPGQLIENSVHKEAVAYIEVSEERIPWDLLIARNVNCASAEPVIKAYDIIKKYYSTVS
jgi:LysR family transcriptional activator of glutamate synthase operon